MWQGSSIDWTPVRAAGIRFAFVKATQNTTFTDPQYAANVAAARAAGVRVGAYDFADPSDGTAAHIKKNAVADATHFLSVAQPQPVDLRPVLDVEQTNGLTAAELTLLGADVGGDRGRHACTPGRSSTPAPTSGRRGWAIPQAVAGRRRPLGGALDDRAQPWVPAADWAGLGWSFWQYTNCRTWPASPAASTATACRAPRSSPTWSGGCRRRPRRRR